MNSKCTHFRRCISTLEMMTSKLIAKFNFWVFGFEFERWLHNEIIKSSNLFQVNSFYQLIFFCLLFVFFSVGDQNIQYI